MGKICITQLQRHHTDGNIRALQHILGGLYLRERDIFLDVQAGFLFEQLSKILRAQAHVLGHVPHRDVVSQMIGNKGLRLLHIALRRLRGAQFLHLLHHIGHCIP